MNLIVSHPTANQNVRAAVRGFVDAGIGTIFQTTIASFPGDLLNALARVRIFSSISKRNFDQNLKHVTETWPWLEVGRLISLKVGLAALTKHEKGYFSIDAIYRNLDRVVANRLENAGRRKINAIYAYEDGALQSFSRARKKGMLCYYDLPIGYWRAAKDIFNLEREKWPEWTATLNGLQNSETKLLRKDQEISLADKIFVASSFTAKTLQSFPGVLPPVDVIPYGFPPVPQNRDYPDMKSRRLKLLFVGGLSQRKGIANLFAAVEGLHEYVSLTVVGRKTTNDCRALNTALKKHTWIPSLPHDEILQVMRNHDVLVFPSLFEGFGLVITEAMSQGTPVITTERTAGPEFIEHGKNGWIVNAGSTEALREVFHFLLDNPHTIKTCGSQAMETARRRPWGVYAGELAESILNHFRINFV